MSAPPRTTLMFAALAPGVGASGDPVADGAGLSLVCRVDFGGLLPKRVGRTIRRNAAWPTGYPEDYARIAYPYALAERDGRKGPTRKAYAHAKAAPVEALADELRDIAAAISLSDAGLPPFGLFVPRNRVDRVPEPSVCKTIAILARRRGEVFLRDSDPVIWSAMWGEALDLWLPVAATRGAHRALASTARRSPRGSTASFPVAQPAFARLLNLLDIEATDAVPTAAVTLGGRSRLLLNPRFVAEKCLADHDLVMLVLHELHHVALGHTRLFARLTPAQNWAFDCVINAQLCRLYPRAASHGALPALLSRRLDARSAPAPTRRLAHVAGALAARARWRGPSRVVQRGERDLRATSIDCFRRSRRMAWGTPATRSRRIASSGTTQVPARNRTSRRTCCARCAASSPSGRWSSNCRGAIRETKRNPRRSIAARQWRAATAILRKAILAIADRGSRGIEARSGAQ